MWGNGGMLSWLIRPDDHPARRFDRAMSTWQCCWPPFARRMGALRPSPRR
ncbi:DUF1963 domain-containing protein [Micromonospora sp. WMMD967]|nr:DUF1963 domain-containing protein [Micromonospora sp. WMMD967]MDG4840289.1 DUF1963 domain-containing protein [Micromonospora sp. WMMD967]